MYGRKEIPRVTFGFRVLALFQRYLLSVYRHYLLLGPSCGFLEHPERILRAQGCVCE